MRARISISLALIALLLPGSIAQAQQRIVSVEWLPLGMHTRILDAMEVEWKSPSTDPFPLVLERLSAFGDAAELGSLLEKVAGARPAQAMGFGNRVSEALAAALPDVPLLAILDRKEAWNKEAARKRVAPALVYLTEPDPSQVWSVATKLLPTLGSLAILYTENFKANVALGDALEADPARAGRRVVRLTVPPGNCRADSDFERALDALRGAKAPTLLYIPDDPNCSRFGNVICKFAAELKILTLGSEAIIGKGCAAALTLDADALGESCAMWMRRHDERNSAIEFRRAPYRVVFDPKAVPVQGP